MQCRSPTAKGSPKGSPVFAQAQQNFLSCPKCTKIFNSRFKLDEHLKNKHPPPKAAPPTRTPHLAPTVHVRQPPSSASRQVGAWKGWGALSTVIEETPCASESDNKRQTLAVVSEEMDEVAAEQGIRVDDSDETRQTEPFDGGLVMMELEDASSEDFLAKLRKEGPTNHHCVDGPFLRRQEERDKGLHIVFVIDASSSMKKNDVEPDDDGKSMTRIRAVLLSCQEFLRAQMDSTLAEHDRYSCISFNDKATTHFSAISASLAFSLLSSGLELHPQLGTSFVAALDAVDELFILGKVDPSCDARILMLTDGRPGDWTSEALDRLQNVWLPKWGDRLQIHSIGFGQDEREFAALQQLALLTGGSFEVSRLSAQAMRRTMSSFCSSFMGATRMTQQMSFNRLHGIGSGYTRKDSEKLGPPPWAGLAVPMVEMKCTRMTPAPWPDFKWKYSCEVVVQRSVLPYSYGSFRLAYGMTHLEPKWENGNYFVSKELRSSQCNWFSNPSMGRCNEEILAHAKNMWSSEVAMYYSMLFDREIEDFTDYRLEFLQCHLYRVNEVMERKGQRALFGKIGVPKFSVVFAAEPHLSGQYKRWTNNSDYICQDLDAAIPDAFVHYTFHKSSGLLLISDLQGSLGGISRNCYTLTDPQVLSHDSSWGPGDTGRKGMTRLMSMHRCGPLCRKLGIDPNAQSPPETLSFSPRARRRWNGTQQGERLAVRDLFVGSNGPRRMLFVGECSLSFCRAAARLAKSLELPWLATDIRWPHVGSIVQEFQKNADELTRLGVEVVRNSVDACRLHKIFPWLQNSNHLEAVVWAMPYPDASSLFCAHPDEALCREMVRLVLAFAASALRILRPGGDAIVLLTSKQHLKWGLRQTVDVPGEGRYSPFVQVYNVKELVECGYRPRFGDHRDDFDRPATYHLSSEIVAVQWRRGDLLTPSGITDSRIAERN